MQVLLIQLITLSFYTSYNKELLCFSFFADSLVFLLIIQHLYSLIIRSQLYFKLQEAFYRALLSCQFYFYFITLSYLKLAHHKETASSSQVLQMILYLDLWIIYRRELLASIDCLYTMLSLSSEIWDCICIR